MALIRLKNEFRDLQTDPPSFGTAEPIDGNYFKWKATLFGAQESPYHGGLFQLSMLFSEDYPFKAPIVRFITQVYHPNIDSNGDICLNILNEDWSPALSISTLLLSISSLLSEPCPDDPIQAGIANYYVSDRMKYNRMARQWTERYAR